MAKDPPKRNSIARDLWTPKYRKRVVPDKKKKESKAMADKDASKCDACGGYIDYMGNGVWSCERCTDG